LINNKKSILIWFSKWLIYFNSNYFYIDKVFYGLYFKQEETEIHILEKHTLKYDFSINNDDFWNKYFLKTNEIYSIFFEVWNINKKNINVTKSELNKIQTQILNLDKNSIDTTIMNILKNSTKELIMYKKFVWSAINSIIWTINNFYSYKSANYFNIWEIILSNFEKYWENFINYNDFKNQINIKQPEFINFVYKIERLFYNHAYHIEPYEFNPDKLLNNIILMLAKLWIVEVYWDIKKWDYFNVNSYYWDEEEYEFNEITYIKFKNLEKKDDNIDNLQKYISWNKIYLNINTDLKLLKKLAEFCVLEQVNKYIILSLSRDTIIKAKNNYKIQDKDIINILKKELWLDVPQNIELMLNDIWKKEDDMIILKTWIPVIVNEIWNYNDIVKLQMFNKYILYKNDKIRLIVFSSKFWSLESLLTKRNIIFNKI
jgi:hypothetical protein